MKEFLAGLGVLIVGGILTYCVQRLLEWRRRIELSADDWEIGIYKDPNSPGDAVVILGSNVPGWVYYLAQLRYVNKRTVTVNLHHLAVEFRRGKDAIYRDTSAVAPAGIDLPPNVTVNGQIDGQYENVDQLRSCDSVWVVGEEIGGRIRKWQIAQSDTGLF